MRMIPAGRLLVLCSVASALLSAVPALAAIDSYMTITGSRQGRFKGEAMSEQIRLISVTRDTPREAAMSTGRRMHSTITITKSIDKSSPMFYQALSTNEVLTEVVISFNGHTPGARTAQKIVLTDASVLSVRKAGGNELITLDYKNIEVTWTDGGKTATDDWSVAK